MEISWKGWIPKQWYIGHQGQLENNSCFPRDIYLDLKEFEAEKSAQNSQNIIVFINLHSSFALIKHNR